ncbi:MAG: hypothetical protein HY901_05805 [Deltaproteobacteria bacterium]|nr:hypothetical protein [Deltaproteobacteria bacterium]
MGLAIGLGAFCFLGTIGGAVGYMQVERTKKQARAGWNLVPVIVANQDIAEDTVLSFDMLSQRPIPEQFVTSSVIKPDSANYIIGQKITVPVQAGDPLLWSQFETSKATNCSVCDWIDRAAKDCSEARRKAEEAKNATPEPRKGPLQKFREAKEETAR